MIKLQELTPSVYYNHSRDFQYIGRLYDIILNYTQTNTQLLNDIIIDQQFNTNFILPALTTLGFVPKHNYNMAQLQAVASIFSEILRNKGSIHSIELICNAMLQADNILVPAEITIEDNELTVCVYGTNFDLALFNDLLDYVLPAGISCTVAKTFIPVAYSTKSDFQMRSAKGVYSGVFDDENISTLGNADFIDSSDQHASTRKPTLLTSVVAN